MVDPGCSSWSSGEDGSRARRFEAPKAVDPMRSECARVLGFEIGENANYCDLAAREFLALYRHMERQKTPSVVPQLLARQEERDRIIAIVRKELALHLRYIDELDNTDLRAAAGAASALQSVLDEIDPLHHEPDEAVQKVAA